ncbi:MAG: hypothetical protein U1F43_34800 [Myxococcota bacterium]
MVAELMIPVARLMMTDAERMPMLRDFLGERIIGHDLVLDAIADVIQRNSAASRASIDRQPSSASFRRRYRDRKGAAGFSCSARRTP